jgi:large subunit ribosomal protein L17
MPAPKKGARFGRDPKHQRLIMANLAASLFEVGYLTTTLAKAKALRPYAEHLVTKAKDGTIVDPSTRVHKQRQVVAKIHDKTATAKLFNEIAPRYAGRPGGYTRILKLGPRPGDNAPMARIEFV